MFQIRSSSGCDYEEPDAEPAKHRGLCVRGLLKLFKLVRLILCFMHIVPAV